MKTLTYVEIDVPVFDAASPAITETYRFAIPTDYLPADIDAIPSIDNVSFSPATISLGEDLGQRASLQITFRDHRHIFGTEEFTAGTFWGKWRARYGTKLRGRALRLIRGTTGQSIDQMTTFHYIIESTNGPTPGAVYTIEAKDVLKLADDDRAQAPRLSNGSLDGSIAAGDGTLDLSPAGIGDLEYPTTGWVCIGGKEVCAFTRQDGGNPDQLTITRGSLGTTAIAHDAGDRVQLCLRYAGDDVADILYDLLKNYTDVSADYITLTDWQNETSLYLNTIYTRTITEPTSVKKLIAELIEQAALAIWWDDQAAKIRLQVLREISTDTDTFDEDRIIAGTLQVNEQPLKRISQIWTYYGQRDPTDSGANEDNFRAALATVDLAREDQYGSAEIKKISAAWIGTINSAERLNQIQLSRFRDPPRSFSFEVFVDEIIALATGYQLEWWANQNQQGETIAAKIQITKLSIHADRISVEAEEMLASSTVILTNIIFLTQGSGTWEVAASWNNADNYVVCIAAGGGGYGRLDPDGSNGGGGGAYSRTNNISLTPGADISYITGAGGDGRASGVSAKDGGDTVFGGTDLADSPSPWCGAEGGGCGTSRTGGGGGGDAANGIGDVRTSGGDGADGEEGAGLGPAGGGGGGGAGGPNGDGGNGGFGTFSSNKGWGGGGGGSDDGDNGHAPSGDHGGVGGDNRFGFGGGTEASPNGAQGGGGRGSDHNQNDGGTGGDGEQIWTQTVNPITSAGPGGGGGGGGGERSGYDGGDFGGGGGGGGGGGAGNGGDGADGVIVLVWRNA